MPSSDPHRPDQAAMFDRLRPLAGPSPFACPSYIAIGMKCPVGPVLLLVWLLGCAPSMRHDSCALVASARRAPCDRPIAYPPQIAGLTLQLRCPLFGVYASSRDESEKILEAVLDEFIGFVQSYGLEPPSGAVILVTNDRECEAVRAEFCPCSLEPRAGTQSLLCRPSCRPYCAAPRGRPLYYCEPFVLAPHALYEASPNGQPIGWAVVLNSRSHFMRSFDSAWEVERARIRRFREALRQKLPDEVTTTAGARLLMGLRDLLTPCFVRKYQRIDERLMALRRREVLWVAWIESCSEVSCATKQDLYHDVETRIAEEWMNLYRNRPRW